MIYKSRILIDLLGEMEEIVTFKADVLLFDGVSIRKQGKILNPYL